MSIAIRFMQSSSRAPWACAWLVASLVLTPSLLAANPKKQAIKQLKQVAATVVKDFKATTKADRTELSAALDLIDADLKEGTADSSQVGDIATALDSFQAAVRIALDQAETDFAEGKATIVSQLASAGITAVADLPIGFQDGGGSIADQHRAAIERALDDLYEGVTDRVRKTADRFDKELGIAVAFRVRTPREYEQRTTGGMMLPFPLTIDVIVAASSTAATNDGRVYLHGFGLAGDGPMSIGMSTKSSQSSSIATVTANASRRWSFTHGNLAEGDRMYAIQQLSDLAGAARASITVP